MNCEMKLHNYRGSTGCASFIESWHCLSHDDGLGLSKTSYTVERLLSEVKRECIMVHC